MHRIFKIAVVTLLTVACVLLGVAVGIFHYSRHDADTKHSALEARVAKLESEVRKHWRFYSRTNRVLSADRRVEDQCRDISLGARTNRFVVMTSKGPGPVAVWLSDWRPRSEMTKFEVFSIITDGKTVYLDVVPRPSESISMEFTFEAVYEGM